MTFDTRLISKVIFFANIFWVIDNKKILRFLAVRIDIAFDYLAFYMLLFEAKITHAFTMLCKFYVSGIAI